MYDGATVVFVDIFFAFFFCFFVAFSRALGFLITPNSSSYFLTTLAKTSSINLACHGSTIITLCLSRNDGVLLRGSVLGVMHLKSRLICVGVKFMLTSCAKKGSPSMIFRLICCLSFSMICSPLLARK